MFIIVSFYRFSFFRIWLSFSLLFRLCFQIYLVFDNVFYAAGLFTVMGPRKILLLIVKRLTLL